MRIRSEHVVRVYDIGMLGTGEPFLVMEHLSGTDLGALVERDGPLRVEDAIEYVLQAIEALAEAHARGIVHRDLKPGNLFLSRRADGSPLVKVLDFGIARSETLEASTLESPSVAGTPVFMAPEQMRSGGVIDARTDVWGLGVTLYALLTGEAPFRAGSLVEVHERILEGAPRVRAARPDAPEALEPVLLRCMARDPAGRFADVAELGAALAALAPEHARLSAQRASRILAAAPIASEGVDLGGASEGEPGTQTLAPTTDVHASASWPDADLGPAVTSSLVRSPPVEVAAPPRAPGWRSSLTLVGVGLGGALIAFAALQSKAPPVVEPPARPPAIAPAPVDTAPADTAPADTEPAKAEPAPYGEPRIPEAERAKPPLLSRSTAAVDAPKPPRAVRPRSLPRDERAVPSPAGRAPAPLRDPLADPN